MLSKEEYNIWKEAWLKQTRPDRIPPTFDEMTGIMEMLDIKVEDLNLPKV
jgi:hypothetical protein